MASTYKVLGQDSTGESQTTAATKAVSSNVATITTANPHNIVFGQQFSIAESEQFASISAIETTSNVTTLTVGSHRVQAGQTMTVTMDDAAYQTDYDGSYVVTSVTSTTITFDNTTADLVSTATTGTVGYFESAFNGTFVVNEVLSDTAFTYITVASDLAQTNTSEITLTYMPWKILYTCPSATSAIVSRIFICNQTEVPATYQIAVSDTLDLENKHLLFHNDVLDPYDTLIISGGIVLDETTKYLLVAADVENVSVSVFGLEAT